MEMLSKDEIDALEKLIDKTGTVNLLFIIQSLCLLKADHIQTCWQDEITAKYWERQGTTIERCAIKISKMN